MKIEYHGRKTAGGANGNKTRLTYPDGGSNYITYVWDEMNRLDMVKDSSENIIADYTYDILSRRTQADLLNGTRADYGYDDIDRLISLVNKKVSPETIFSEYLFALYDNVGNLKQMSRDGEGYTFGYDTIYQLKTTDYPEGHHSSDTGYDYDSLGNRTSIIGGGLESYTTNDLNQYTYVSGTAFSYDNSGNLISDGTNTYAYDSENRLTSATMGSGTFTYTYDPFGRRTRKQGPGMDVTYVYDNNQVIEERDSGGAVIATYVYGPGIDECITMERGGETYYYHYDRLGSVVNLSNSSGDLVETYQYDAWGNADTYGAVDNPYFFTGRRYDNETGLYYYRARYYDPAIGRFLQTDPLHYYDGPNLYSYVTNNPMNLIDPFGLWEVKTRDLESRAAAFLGEGYAYSDKPEYGEHWQMHYSDGTNAGYLGDDPANTDTPIIGPDRAENLGRYNSTPIISGPAKYDAIMKQAEMEARRYWEHMYRQGQRYRHLSPYTDRKFDCQEFIWEMIRRYLKMIKASGKQCPDAIKLNL